MKRITIVIATICISTSAFAGGKSAPSPAQCVVVLPELFGALSRGYIDVGAQGKAEKVLDVLAAELKVK